MRDIDPDIWNRLPISEENAAIVLRRYDSHIAFLGCHPRDKGSRIKVRVSLLTEGQDSPMMKHLFDPDHTRQRGR
jgi:hypothetical protein